MFLSDLSIKRPIMVTMGLVVFLIFGALGYFSLTLNLMPEFNIGFVTVQTIYPGAGPKEVETQLSKKIEDAVGTISNIDMIQSYSMESVSYVIIKFELGKDVDIANQEVKDKVNSILNQFPQDAQLPVVQKFDIQAQPIIDIVLSGPQSLPELYELADKKVKDRLSQVEGVAQVNLSGGQERQIRVELDNRTVYQNVLSLAQLSQIIAAHNMDMPAGHFTQSGQEYSVRLRGEVDAVERLGEIEIPTAFGNKKLAELAKITDASAEIRERTTYYNAAEQENQNNNFVVFSLIKSSDGNTVKMSESTAKLLPRLEKELPDGCRLTMVRDKSIFIKSSVDDTMTTIFLGIVLTGLVLLFFLHDIRSTIIVATAMPYSIISTFLFLQLFGFSLNIMTLMGLSTAVGILVTNSVVVLENIFRHKEMGHSRNDAANKGTTEIAVAVIASTMTNIVVFLPIATMSSMIGQVFKEFALTVTFATVFSLIASFTITPMLASLILPEVDKKKHPLGGKLEKMFHSWESRYKRWLGVILKNKWRSASVIFVSFLLFAGSLFLAGKVGFEFMPLLDEGDIKIDVELPQGYELDETAKIVNTIETRLKEYSEVNQILTTLGSISDLDKGVNLAVIQVKLIEADLRAISSEQMANTFIMRLSDIPNAMIRVAAVSSMAGGGDAPIQFNLMGQDMDKLESYKREIIGRIRDVDGLVNLNTSSRSGKPEITFVPNRHKLAEAGLTVFDIAMTLRAAIEGVITTKYREKGNEYDIRVRLTDSSTNSPEKIKALAIASRRGVYRLEQLAEIEFTEGYSKILHMDRYKSILFSGHSAPGFALGDIVDDINERTADMNLPDGYKIDWGGDAEMMAETAADMLQTFIIAFLLTYMLLAAILESFTQPAMILGTVPLALVGVFGALYITGLRMNTISMMAIVMLLGIVVNNAILLLDYANILRRKGKSVRDALLEAGATKLKPILMATVAIILGMAPMALGMGSAGVEFRQSMGVVSIGGLIVSSVLTLFVIPALYYLTTKEVKID